MNKSAQLNRIIQMKCTFCQFEMRKPNEFNLF